MEPVRAPVDADIRISVVTKPEDDGGALARADLQTQVDYTVLSPLAYRAVFASLMLMCFMVGLDITIIVTAMPKIASQFNSFGEISWIVTAFLLAQTAVSPLVGRLSEAFGRRTIILLAVFLFTIFSLACALATSFEQLAVFRALQGVGGGLVMPSVIIIISDITSMASRGIAMAPIMLVFTVSSVIGPLLGGFLTDVSETGWRLCFWINVPIGILAAIVIFICIPTTLGVHAAKFDVQRSASGIIAGSRSDQAALEKQVADAASEKAAIADGATVTTSVVADDAPVVKKKLDLDLLGSVLGVISITALCLSVTWGGGEYSWSDGRVFGLLIVAGVVGVAFVCWEILYAANPIVPFRLFAVRNFAVATWIFFWSGFGMMATTVYLPIYFQLVWGQDATASGVSLIPMMVSFPFGSISAGVAMAKTGKYYYQPLIGAVLMAVGSALLTLFSPTTIESQRIGYLIIVGLSCGLTIATPTATAQAAVLGRDRAVTTSTVSFFGVLGRLLASAVGQALLNNNLAARKGSIGPSYSAKQAYSDAITPVYYLGVAGGVLLFLGALFCEHIPLSTGHAAKEAPEKGAVAVEAAVAAEK